MAVDTLRPRCRSLRPTRCTMGPPPMLPSCLRHAIVVRGNLAFRLVHRPRMDSCPEPVIIQACRKDRFTRFPSRHRLAAAIHLVHVGKPSSSHAAFQQTESGLHPEATRVFKAPSELRSIPPAAGERNGQAARNGTCKADDYCTRHGDEMYARRPRRESIATGMGLSAGQGPRSDSRQAAARQASPCTPSLRFTSCAGAARAPGRSRPRPRRSGCARASCSLCGRATATAWGGSCPGTRAGRCPWA
jgi:hypothetical protein